ncbi:bifunctional diaminohydroxyphosphoribosylaminopyrimidine deaminase/5-amino-6-(5-phosphoribosylamino)uracil reductase RibD [Brevibacillus humidisoli]|uniref:bifunctional diaminohydroxyphosphoribosylaminopyrimidine deaminase/5-amino-6-(5-phosphoribosylamino)uracil reductase RibD n=1 Tax=Brevibacillus humidisoli TaxID=2895522 RepID=UPI001E5596DE|nr:bifunctional diaminohydroxyphosphoribosylaminopyrimidine deaminase/5-amino-6-(5-phosphoribosylamino)uracil reductase RibD [Brevibacillus humidisoli]UFJ43185.1 bifunctional diaminohydroxyphosphoribosylaminopyrimidine deaminase/5-amino-6-(5-phosphoribosylamino)uracil reductase RibD [Brevibacillus humidisoli]
MRDADYMSVALQMAQGTAGQTSPNPMVGAVVVRNGAIVGMGAHLRAGEAHAEVHALAMAGEKARGADLYVTLEPCSHTGRTPPCVEAIIHAGVARVVVAACDPNPKVAGKGIKRLQEAGIHVTVGVLEEQARQLNEIFFHYITTGRPFVTVKTASTLDGKTATGTGHSRWVSGREAREEVHVLRHQYDAILVGVGTVIADDPALTVRLPDGHARHPIRVILDTTLRTPPTAKVVTDGEAATWIYTTDRAPLDKQEQLAQQGVEVIRLGDSHKVDVLRVLESLGKRGVSSLLVEGGAEINGAFLTAQAINKVISYVSLKLVGGAGAPTPFGGSGLPTMDEAVPLDRVEVERINEQDLRIVGYPRFVQGEGE